MASSNSEDPHSFAIPELANIIDIHLELYVDFDKKILKGKAILTIEKKYSAAYIVLDTYELVIKCVTNPVTGAPLQYHIGFQQSIGRKFTITLPTETEGNFFRPKCKVQIEYETSPNSPALHWLTPLQTVDGTHPFLMSNNKLIYARAVFPCQDTPSVKFSYTAKIIVPKNFTVLMSALLKNVNPASSQLNEYNFLQAKPVPSYAVIIAVGSLQKRYLSVRSNVFAENAFINDSIDTFRSGVIESMLETAESLCGTYFWDRYDICVLPPSIAHFDIECPCVAFISPIHLCADRYGISSLARNIAQSWAGYLVTCANYNDLWLNKSFSMFICRKIICKIWFYSEAELFIERLAYYDLHRVQSFDLKSLILDSKDLLTDSIKYVPYEIGCILLNMLQKKLGGSSVFEPFLKSYFYKFAHKSINTDDWKKYLYEYFPENTVMLESVDWDTWFHCTDYKYIDTETKKTTLEVECFKLAETWAKWDVNTSIPSVLYQIKYFCDIKLILFLNYLHDLHMYLNVTKMHLISSFFETKSYQIQFHWLMLCLKVRWQEKILVALNFAIIYPPNYMCHIFQYLSQWSEYRQLLIKTFMKNKKKMLPDTQNKLKSILCL